MSHFIVILLSLVGLTVSAYIRFKKTRGQHLFCFLGSDCSAVVNSSYSKTFGLSNELVGICYYTLAVLVYSTPLKNIVEIDLALFLISAIAAGFSLYLVYLQARVLKKWCEWCLVSTFCSLGIFLILLF